MATTNSNAQNIWAKFWDIVKDCVGFIVLLVVVVICIIFVYNPFFLPFWVLLGYRKNPADTLLKEETEFANQLFQAAPQAFCRWEIFCFPWFMKKDFVRMYPSEFSAKDQVRLALELPMEEKQEFISRLTTETLNVLWQRANFACNTIIADIRLASSLDQETLAFLLENGDIKRIKGFISRKAPSTLCILDLIRASALDSQNKVAIDALQYTVLKHGLSESASILEEIYKSQDEDLKGKVEEAIVCHNQYQMVKKLCETPSDELWKTFCEQNPYIWVEAQKKMSYLMLETYYATGHKLSEGAVIYFLSKEDKKRTEIAKIIFKNEDKFSDKTLSVIRCAPDVYTAYLQVENARIGVV